MTTPCLIYGANGYTGELVARRAVSQGLQPVLAGRNADAVARLAAELKLEHRIARLDEREEIDAALEGMNVVIHCAGPFAKTAKSMLNSCLRKKVHYLDVTGEIDVFEMLAMRGEKARTAGIMVMPGVGFDVVPSDCVAVHLKRRLPTATHLTLAMKNIGRPSHGTTATTLRHFGLGVVRKDGKLTRVPAGHHTREVDFGNGKVKVIAIPWGDVSTAFYSTGIPNIETMIALPLSMRWGLRSTRVLAAVLNKPVVQQFLQSRIPAGGPDEAARHKGRSLIWGEVVDAAGERRISRLHTLEGYDLTCQTAVGIAQRVLAGEVQPGFQTPAGVYGPDLILSAERTTLEDVE